MKRSAPGLAVFLFVALFSIIAVAQMGTTRTTSSQAEAPSPATGKVIRMQPQNGEPARANGIPEPRQGRGSGIGGAMGISDGLTVGGVLIGGIEFTSGGVPVKGAPFAADEIHETVRVLPDGRRIIRTYTIKIYRDSEGRTRIEPDQNATAINGLKTGRPEIVISDPTAGVNYMLDMDSRTVRRVPLPQVARGASTIQGSVSGAMRWNMAGSKGIAGEAKVEPLGTEMMEGVEARGERVTRTIPGWEVGNEEPIVITSERWVSPRLQLLVLLKLHDPRFGDTTLRMTNIHQAEPLPSLFQVPSDFVITEPQIVPRAIKRGPLQLQ